MPLIGAHDAGDGAGGGDGEGDGGGGGGQTAIMRRSAELMRWA